VIIGENFVKLTGTIKYPELKTVGAGNYSLFKGKLAIPVQDKEGRFQYLKIAAWNDLAEALNEVGDRYITIHGHIEERSYDGKCRHCGGPEKKYWTEVVVDNFVPVEGV
jgi:hypothetical protein